MDPGFPHGTSPWAEDPREDKSGDPAVASVRRVRLGVQLCGCTSLTITTAATMSSKKMGLDFLR